MDQNQQRLARGLQNARVSSIGDPGALKQVLKALQFEATGKCTEHGFRARQARFSCFLEKVKA